MDRRQDMAEIARRWVQLPQVPMQAAAAGWHVHAAPANPVHEPPIGKQSAVTCSWHASAHTGLCAHGA